MFSLRCVTIIWCRSLDTAWGVTRDFFGHVAVICQSDSSIDQSKQKITFMCQTKYGLPPNKYPNLSWAL